MLLYIASNALLRKYLLFKKVIKYFFSASTAILLLEYSQAVTKKKTILNKPQSHGKIHGLEGQCHRSFQEYYAATQTALLWIRGAV